MNKAIILHSVVPLRDKPDEGSEQLTQLMFGETCTILEQLPRWWRLRNDYDGQEGWADFKMITPLTDEQYDDYSHRNRTAIVKFPMAFAVSDANIIMPLTAGTRLTDYHDGTFAILGTTFHIDPQLVAERPLELTDENFWQVARYFMNIPYLWGGKNCMGMDCSGLSGVLLSIFGVRLLRNAREQITQGTKVESLSQAKCGDLAFFNHVSRSKDQTNISHVGILLNTETIMHCSGRVKLEKITPEGILFETDHSLTHDLVEIRRYC